MKSLGDRNVLARILEVASVAYLPSLLTDWRVLAPMRLATGGTVLACRLALQHGIAVNLAGGYHHAGPNKGSGFCAYADAPLALAMLKDENKISSALVVDTDAHQGNGTADAIRSWSWAHILDFLEDIAVPLLAGICGAQSGRLRPNELCKLVRPAGSVTTKEIALASSLTG